MNFNIIHETQKRMRIALIIDQRNRKYRARVTEMGRQIKNLTSVQSVCIYPSIASLAVIYTVSRETLLNQLRRLGFYLVASPRVLKEQNRDKALEWAPYPLTLDELEHRKWDISLKGKRIREVLIDGGVDMILPGPLAFCYHLWQLIDVLNR